MIYEGELDSSGQACGIGSVIGDHTRSILPSDFLDKEIDTNHKVNGTWFKNLPHGICK